MYMAGRQHLIAGHPRRTPMPRMVNINIEKQNYYGMMPMNGFYQANYCQHAYGCDNGGMGTLGKIMMGVGLLGGIAGAIWGGAEDGAGGVDSKPQLSPEQQEMLQQQKEAIDTLKEQVEQLTQQLIEQTKNKRSDNHNAEVDEVAALKAKQPVTTGEVPPQYADGTKDTPGAETVDDKNKAQAEIGAKKVEGETTTFTFNVSATKDKNGNVTGYTGYNIVAGLYKDADGNALKHSEIKAIAEEIFQGKALPKGDIHLPKEINVGGKTYKIADDAKQENVKTSTYTLAENLTMFTSTAKKEDDHWVGFVNGEPIEGQFDSEEAAKAAAEKAAKAQTETE